MKIQVFVVGCCGSVVMLHIAHFCVFNPLFLVQKCAEWVHICGCLKMQCIAATVGEILDILHHGDDVAEKQDEWYCVVNSSQKGDNHQQYLVKSSC